MSIKKENTKVLFVRIKVSKHKTLKEVSEITGYDMSDLIRPAIDDAIDRLAVKYKNKIISYYGGQNDQN